MNLISCLLLLLALSGCGAQSLTSGQNSTSATPTQINQMSQSTDPLMTNYPDAPEWTIAAWHQFTADGRYRLARKSDFDIPTDSVSDRYKKIDISDAISRPFVVVDANHDNRFKDLVVLVVDSSRADSAKFGIVIFNEPAKKNETSEPHWLYRDNDLSRTTLSPWSGGLTVRTYHDDGTYNACYVTWNSTGGYSCIP